MEKLHVESSGISSAVLNVREDHPSVGVPQHGNLEEKRACVTWLSREDGEARTIFIDSFEGAAHKTHGACPKAVSGQGDRVSHFKP